ncbi:hypothetical protein [Actinomyces wuliandei]|uniref:hypothetical protein n=1 Tax=Actinomyces wuliandei TaxID=2057743 RepID=UPI000FDA2ECE|nr:hypothetical protein [Actinomyces wuliandei]
MSARSASASSRWRPGFWPLVVVVLHCLVGGGLLCYAAAASQGWVEPSPMGWGRYSPPPSPSPAVSAQEAEELCASGMEEAPALTVAQAQTLSGKDVYVCSVDASAPDRLSVSATAVPDLTVEPETRGERVMQEEFLARAADGDMPSWCEEYDGGSRPRHAVVVDGGRMWRIRILSCGVGSYVQDPPRFPWED